MPREPGPVCMIDLSHAPLPDEKIRALIERWRTGDKEAANLIIQHNDRLVYKIAMRYYMTQSGLNLEDLMQWGRLGIWRALKDFRLDNGNNFSTYATWWIRLYISRYGKRESAVLAISYQADERRGKVGKARAGFIQDKHREPTTEELAEITGYKAAYIQAIRAIVVSLEETAGAIRPFSETIPDDMVDVEDEATDRADEFFALRIHDYVNALPETWQAVIVARFGLGNQPPRSLKAISAQMAISIERVRQIEAAALTKLREFSDFF